MYNSLDENFLALYRSIKTEKSTNDLYRFLNYSFTMVYLHVKGRKEYKTNNIFFLKRLIFSLKEKYKAKKILNRVLCNGNFNCIIIINESSHLKHAFPLKEDLKDFRPLYITNKQRYISTISEGFKTKNVVYIPKTIVKKPVFKSIEIVKLFSKFSIDINDVEGIENLLNDSYKNYDLTKNFVDTVIEKNKIQFAYVFNDILFTGRVIIDICNNNGIKTYYLMHGLLSDEFIENLHICNNFLVFGDYTRDILVKKEDITNDKIITLGAPYLREQLKLEQKVFFKEEVINSLPKKKKIALVLLSGPGHSTSEKHHKCILKTLKSVLEDKQKDYYFVFKLHWKDSINYYNAILNDSKIKMCSKVYRFDVFHGKETIFDWIKIADLIITGASSTALEAMYMGKPVITVDIKGEFDYQTEFIQQGATYHCKTKEDLYETLDNLLDGDFSISSKAREVVNLYFADSSNIQKFHKETLPKEINY